MTEHLAQRRTQSVDRERGRTLRERVAGEIVAAAAGVFARHGAGASMADVATDAGVARATVYRYFPTRQALMERLVEVAIEDAGTRLHEARLRDVPVEEGVARAARALLEVGDYFTVLARERIRLPSDEYEQRLLAPLRELFEEGQARGALRSDVPAGWLTDAFVSFVVSAAAAAPRLGRHDGVAAIAALFLDGARAGATEPETASVATMRKRRKQ